MLRDDIELLSGRIIEGSLTPALFLLLKESQDIEKLCNDLRIERGTVCDNKQCGAAESGENAIGGFNLEEWLANNAKPVSL